jgi:hypothetical protein
MGEENVSTKQYSTEKNPWIQEADVYQGRAAGPQAEESEGQEETDRQGKGILRADSSWKSAP